MPRVKMLKTLARNMLLPLVLGTAAPACWAFGGLGTVTLASGNSTLSFSEQFFNLFPTLGGQIGQYGQAKFKGSLNKQNLRLIFPIASGTLNPSPFNNPQAYYNVAHQGGWLLSRPGTGLYVVFDTPELQSTSGADNCWLSSPCLQLGATLIVNGSVQSVVPNFAQSTSSYLTIPIKAGNQVNLNNIQLYLTQKGADLMNSFFALNQGGPITFAKGYPLGSLTVQGRGAKVICPPGLRYNGQVQQCL